MLFVRYYYILVYGNQQAILATQSTGVKMSYQPKLTDPRVQRRVIAGVRAVEKYVKPNQVYTISQSQRAKWFGMISNPLSVWLDQQLLETVDPYFNMSTGQCKKYRLNESAFANLKSQLGLESYTPSTEIQQQIESGNFEYNEKSDRWYSEAQYIPSKIRGKLLANAGYRYKYDIEAAAPTILLQRAQQIRPDFQAPALQQYIQDRTQVRNQIAAEASATQDQVKLVLNAVLQGSFLSTHSTSKLFDVLNQDYALVSRLKLSTTLQELKTDIKRLWQCLRNEFEREYFEDKNGTKRCRKLSARTKSAYYRKYENEVAKVIQRVLKKQKSRYLWIHDGWQSDQMTDPNELQTQIRRKTGFVVRIDYEVYQDDETQ